jgi:hypothetical protein
MRHQDALVTIAIAKHVDIAPPRAGAEFSHRFTVFPADFDK